LLNDGIEVYTKNEVADKINILKPYLLRDTQTNFNDLQQTLNTYIITLEKRIPLMNSTIEYKYQTIE
jgi:hypothetical protein